MTRTTGNRGRPIVALAILSFATIFFTAAGSFAATDIDQQTPIDTGAIQQTCADDSFAPIAYHDYGIGAIQVLTLKQQFDFGIDDGMAATRAAPDIGGIAPASPAESFTSTIAYLNIVLTAARPTAEPWTRSEVSGAGHCISTSGIGTAQATLTYPDARYEAFGGGQSITHTALGSLVT